MDKIIIKDLLVRGIIGINDWERRRAQNILINIVIFTDTRRAAETDHINDCVDYSKMSKKSDGACRKRATPHCGSAGERSGKTLLGG